MNNVIVKTILKEMRISQKISECVLRNTRKTGQDRGRQVKLLVAKALKADMTGPKLILTSPLVHSLV